MSTEVSESQQGLNYEQRTWTSKRDRLKSQSMVLGWVSTLFMAAAVGVLIFGVNAYEVDATVSNEAASAYISINWLTVGLIGIAVLAEVVGSVIYSLRMRKLGSFPGARKAPSFGRKILIPLYASLLIDLAILTVAVLVVTDVWNL